MNKRKILLADDDADDREMFEEILSSNEKITLVNGLENGKELLVYLEKLPVSSPLPDLIVLDQNMPKLNGLQTLEILKKDNRYQQIPVVIFSTYANEKLIQDCRRLGAATVFTKPSSYDEYEKMIDYFLEVIDA